MEIMVTETNWIYQMQSRGEKRERWEVRSSHQISPSNVLYIFIYIWLLPIRNEIHNAVSIEITLDSIMKKINSKDKNQLKTRELGESFSPLLRDELMLLSIVMIHLY